MKKYLLPLFAFIFATNSFAQFSGKTGDLDWEISLYRRVLTISGKGTIPTSTNAPWSPYRTIIEGIVISEGITSIENYAFNYYTNIKFVTIPSSTKTMGWYAFSGCTNLESVTIQHGLTNIGFSAFQFCTNLTSINIPESVERIENYAFEHSGLVDFTIPKSVSYIGDRILGSCNQLVNINVDTMNDFYCSIDGILYNKNKSKLIQYPSGKDSSDFTIPNNVEIVENYAFSNNKHLTHIYIPTSVRDVGNGSFSGTKLQEIKVKWSEPLKLPYNTFFAFNTSSCKLLVPKGTSEAYKTADVWKDFIIEEYTNETAIKQINSESSNFNVYGFENSITINSTINSNAKIYSIDGKLIKMQPIKGGINSIPIEKGIYFVVIDSNSYKVLVK